MRCEGSDKPGHYTGFQCVLDAGHDGRCKPYQAPTVEEWRVMNATINRLARELAAESERADRAERNAADPFQW
jgi:hypothetical protein